MIEKPAFWTKLEDLTFPGIEWPVATVWIHPLMHIKVLRSFAYFDHDEKWIHISFSREDRIPSWSDLTKVKNDFLGDEREAIKLIPKKNDYVNFDPFCLHIWSPLQSIAVYTSFPNLRNLKFEIGA